MNEGLRVVAEAYSPAVGTPALLAHTAVQAPSLTEPGPTSGIDTSGATLIVVIAATYDGGIGPPLPYNCLVADKVGGTVATTPFTITSCTVSVEHLTIHGTFPSGGSNAYAGKYVSLNGYLTGDIVNNGCWPCTASTTTTMTLTTSIQCVATSATGYALISDNQWRALYWQVEYCIPRIFYTWAPANVGSGHTFTFATITGDGGSIAVAAFSGTKVSSDPYQAGTNLQDYVLSSSPLQVGTITSTSFALGTLTINGTWTNGVTNSCVGRYFTVSGFTGGAAVNNGTWPCTASSTGTFALTVPGGNNLTTGTGVVSIVPHDANTLIIAAASGQNIVGPVTVGSSFTLLESTSGSGKVVTANLAYYITPDTASVNPLWTPNSAIRLAATIAAFSHAGR